MTMVSADGWRVERVVRHVPGRGPSMRLRVSWRGYWQADCETSDEVAGYVDISTLVPSVTHLYQRAYPVTPWKKAADLLDAEMGRALEAAVPATAGGVLPAPRPGVLPPAVIG